MARGEARPAVATATAPASAPHTPAQKPRTFVYKKAGECELRADVYRLHGDAPRPVIVWIHGGALILGSRSDIPRRQRDRYLQAGYTLVAIDYRLAPETKAPAILDDVRDALRWVREQGPVLFGADPNRIAVVGHSAGGYLTLLAGCRAEPRPRVLVSFYGYGDITGEWLTRPAYRGEPLVPEPRARRAIGRPCPMDELGGRLAFYKYCRQQAIWTREASGIDPTENDGVLDTLCPLRLVDSRFPPTLLLHGDQDEDVPCEQSVLMARALERVNVEHRLVTIPGGHHGFDHALDAPQVREAFEAVLAFLRKHL